jgi:hypothetical protein
MEAPRCVAYAARGAEQLWGQKATSADDRIESALLPRTDVAPAAGGAVRPRGMTIRARMHVQARPAAPII